jgi:hypothetical protein
LKKRTKKLLLASVITVLDGRVNHGIKVFCFFFSKKKYFLATPCNQSRRGRAFHHPDFRGRHKSAVLAAQAAATMRDAIGTGVPSVIQAIRKPLELPMTNCMVPMTAEALPACAAWRVRAPTVPVGLMKP